MIGRVCRLRADLCPRSRITQVRTAVVMPDGKRLDGDRAPPWRATHSIRRATPWLPRAPLQLHCLSAPPPPPLLRQDRRASRVPDRSTADGELTGCSATSAGRPAYAAAEAGRTTSRRSPASRRSSRRSPDRGLRATCRCRSASTASRSRSTPPRSAREGLTYPRRLVTAEFVNFTTGEIKSQTVFWVTSPPDPRGPSSSTDRARRRLPARALAGRLLRAHARQDSDKDVFTAKIILSWGAWLEFEIDKRDFVGVRVDRKRKQSVTVLLGRSA